MLMRGLNSKLALVAFMLAAAPMALAQDRDPSGTIDFSGNAVAVGIGYSWGNGTLDFKGQKYPFTIYGVSLIDVGAASFDGSGDVYNITNPQQLAGNYVAAGVGAAIAQGGSVVALQNGNGVVIHLHTNQEGLRFNLSASGVSIRMKSS
jgi:type 1 fimbria pilin